MASPRYDPELLRKEAQFGPQFETDQEVTPELAAAWLHLLSKQRQRDYRPRRAGWFATLVERGEYVNDGTPIRFDTDGNLVDGQHRLGGCVQAGKPITVDIRRRLPVESITAMDKAMRRTAGDSLRIWGYEGPNVQLLANTAGWLARYDGKRMADASWIPTEQQIREQVDQGGHRLIRNMDYLYPHLRTARLGSNYGLTIALFHLCHETHPGSADEFYWRVYTGLELRDGTPEALLRFRLLEWAHARSLPRPWLRGAVIVRAWNAYVDQVPLQLLRTPGRHEDFPVIR